MEFNDLFVQEAKPEYRYGVILKLFDHCNELNRRIEVLLADESNMLETLWKEESGNSAELDPILMDGLVEKYDEATYKIENLFPYILRSSLFLSCYAFFENALQQICWLYETKLKHDLKLEEINGKGIFRCRIFLKKVVGIKFPDDEPEWVELLFYNEIRNLVAHGSERIDEKDPSRQKLINEIKKRPLISIKNGAIILNNGFVSGIIGTMENFMKKMYQRMPEGF